MGAPAEGGGRLSLWEKLGYGAGDTASHFVWDMVGFWLLVFYTDTLGITAAAAGTIMLVARIWDMVTDPLMGVVADRTRTRWGKFRPWILWMALPYGALAVAAFSAPDLGDTGKVLWAAGTYILLMTVYTAITDIVLMMTAFPGALYLAAGALFFLYDLDRDTSRRMAADLAERRAPQES